MNEITQVIESIKAGELGIATQRLSLLQNEVTHISTLIQELTDQVEGVTNDPTNQVGVIHSPARPGRVNTSIEMFIGDYFVGDIEEIYNPYMPAVMRKGTFIFGVESECKYHFIPTDPLHAVNKKYVDQCVSPIASQLLNMICRFGDRVPLNPHNGTIPSGTYIFTSNNIHEQVQWLFNDAETRDLESEFYLNPARSKFWINIEDGRYYGETTRDEHLLTVKVLRDTCISKKGSIGSIKDANGIKSDWTNIIGTPAEIKDAAILFTNSKLKADSKTRFILDPNEITYAKKNANEIATIKDLRDSILLSGISRLGVDYISYNGATLKNVDWCGHRRLGINPITPDPNTSDPNPELVLYWCQTVVFPPVPVDLNDAYHIAQPSLPLMDSDNGCDMWNPEFIIEFPPNLFDRILMISPTFSEGARTIDPDNHDGWIQLMNFDPLNTRDCRIKFQFFWTGNCVGYTALLFVVGLKNKA